MGLCSVKWCQGQSVIDEVGVKRLVSAEVMAVEFRQNIYNVNISNQKTKRKTKNVKMQKLCYCVTMLHIQKRSDPDA